MASATVDRKVGWPVHVQVQVTLTAAEWRRLTGQPDVSPVIEQLARLSDQFLGAALDEMTRGGEPVVAAGSEEGD